MGSLEKQGPVPHGMAARTRLKKHQRLATCVRAMDAMRTGGLRGENPAAAWKPWLLACADESASMRAASWEAPPRQLEIGIWSPIDVRRDKESPAASAGRSWSAVRLDQRGLSPRTCCFQMANASSAGSSARDDDGLVLSAAQLCEIRCAVGNGP